MSNQFEVPVSLNDATDGLSEESVSLSDFAEEVGGAWPKGWYPAEVIEGYTTKSGKVFSTADEPSKSGDSRNLRVCFRITNAKGEERTTFETFNYRLADFTKERLGFIKASRVEFGKLKRWPDTDAQRSSIAVASIGQFQKAIGFTELKLSAGAILPGIFVGQKVDVRLGVNEDGYNEITGHAAAGSQTAKAKP